MNERIKELAEHAGCVINWKVAGIQEYHERFAELIQKDMIRQCRDMFCVGSVSWNLLNEKLEHFGVE
jgi:hypothetical protein